MPYGKRVKQRENEAETESHRQRSGLRGRSGGGNGASREGVKKKHKRIREIRETVTKGAYVQAPG